MTKIIMDSTADLPSEFIEKYDIDIIPLRINIDSKEYLDKETIEVEKVYDEMRKGIIPRTSSPFPKDVYDLFEGYVSSGKDIIYYAFSSKLSGTYQVAYLAIKELKTRYPDVNMKIIDTKAGALGSGLIVYQGAKLREIGKSFEEIVKISEENVEHIEHLFTIDDLDWLLKGGRISKGEALIGGALNIKPLLEINDGKIVVIDKKRGRKRSLRTLVDIMNERIKEFPNQIIGIGHAGDFEAVEQIRDMVVKELNHENIVISKIGSVLASHLGIGGIGIFFLNKEPEVYIDEL